MSRPTLLPSCVAFCSILFLTLATGCRAFPQVERRETSHAYAEKEQPQKMNTDDQENISFAPKYTPQQMSSDAPMGLSAGPSVTPLHKVFSVSRESHLAGAGLLYATSTGVYSSGEPVVSTSDQEHSPSQLERMSPEHSLSKSVLTVASSSPASLNPDQEEPYSSSSTQSMVQGITDGAHGFLEYLDNQVFATESQEAVSLGKSPPSSINTKETENIKADAAMRTTAFPHVDSTREMKPDRERPSEMAVDNVESNTTKYLVTLPKNVLTIEPTADSVLGNPKVTVSVGTPDPVSSVFSEEWDDTKFESINRGRPPESGDNAETQVRTEQPHGNSESFEGTEESPTSTEVAKVAPGLPGGETPLGTTLVTALGDERSTVLTHQISFTPTSPVEDPEVSTMKLFSSAGGFTASTQGDRTQLSSETAVSLSQYESVPQQAAGNVLKEMTMATQEIDSTLPVVTQEHMTTVEVPRGSGEPEEAMPSLSSVSAEVDDAELSRRWESLATPASTTVVPLSLQLTSSMEDLMDTITGPNEEFIPVLGSPMTPPAVTVEAPTISPALPSEGRTSPSLSRPNTAASYGLEQLESEEVEDDEDEEDEDEEEEEDDEEDEEDEEDKEADSLYKDFNSDTEPPGYTLPGITSQEPDIGPGSIDLLEVATYQVPETIEWEQQNQGLVRSWMEKLKDKAGYMSGMLVPVGVGIAGALFILGALYSIKVMNRRRRNGFKRHKRKQREFNSMQDRVMLLADSSEDEF